MQRLAAFARLEPWQRTLWITFLAQLVSATGFSLIFPFLPLYVASLGTRTGLSLEFWAGMAFSAQAATMMLASPIWGTLADRYGRKLMVERAMFGGAVVLGLMAFVRSAEELVLLRCLQGLITGTISASNALVAAEAPRQRVGYAMGVVQAGLWSGVAVGPLLGGAMADLWGYRIPFLITAGLLLFSGLWVWRGVHETVTPRTFHPSTRLAFWTTWKQLLQRSSVRLAYAARFLSAVGVNMVLPVAPLFIKSLLASEDLVGTYTGLAVGLGSAASTLSGIYLGRLGDRVGHRRVLLIGLLAAGLLYLPQAFASAAWQLLVLQGLVGAAAGGVTPALSALLVHGTQPGTEGATYGLDNSITSGARALAPLLGAGVAMVFGVRCTFLAVSAILIVTAGLVSWRLPKHS